MVIECIVIIGVFVLMEIAFLKSRHKVWALAVLPLGIVPLTNIVIELLVKKLFHAEITDFVGVLVLTIAVAVEAALLGFCSSLIESKRSKASFISISNTFNIALAIILIHNILA
ncbi:MAG: hypothetical protein J1F04_00560 [Oscillospiraceae bacterium]|nr:hypothetical protein [Oscillospiraceae bacterium]MCH5207346.1 hypothetical protein [Oscillospiraceae bacterium]